MQYFDMKQFLMSHSDTCHATILISVSDKSGRPGGCDFGKLLKVIRSSLSNKLVHEVYVVYVVHVGHVNKGKNFK